MKERKVKTKTNSSLHLFFLNLRKIFSENEIYILVNKYIKTLQIFAKSRKKVRDYFSICNNERMCAKVS